jgi:hypothetical protein
MGLSDFTPHTQDLTAIEILRSVRAIDSLVNGDINDAIRKASGQWESLPMGPGQANRPLNGHPSGQPYMPYDDVLTTYKKFGGTTKLNYTLLLAFCFVALAFLRTQQMCRLKKECLS